MLFRSNPSDSSSVNGGGLNDDLSDEEGDELELPEGLIGGEGEREVTSSANVICLVDETVLPVRSEDMRGGGFDRMMVLSFLLLPFIDNFSLLGLSNSNEFQLVESPSVGDG